MISLPLLVLAGCATDFGLQEITDPESLGDDTAAPALDDEDSELEEEEDTGDSYEPANDEGENEEEEEEEPTYEEEPPEDDCTETSDLIYVVERDNDTIYLFDPETLSFESLGSISCSMYGTPGSMAVSRSGLAYVRYSDDSLYEIDLATMGCFPTSYSSPNNFGSFGMGYATDDGDTWNSDDRQASLRLGTSAQASLTTADPGTQTIDRQP